MLFRSAVFTEDMLAYYSEIDDEEGEGEEEVPTEGAKPSSPSKVKGKKGKKGIQAFWTGRLDPPDNLIRRIARYQRLKRN